MIRHGYLGQSLRVIGCFSLVALLTCALAEPSWATPLSRGTHVGATVIFADVFEDSATDPALVTPAGGLFGVPTVAGDALDFNPKSFAAAASGAGGVDFTDGNLQFDIVAKPGKAISSVAFSERGDTTLSGFSGDAFTSVTTQIFIDILEVNGVPTSIDIPGQSMTFTPSAGDYQLTVDGSGPLYNTDWSGSILIDLGPFLPVGVLATKVHVSLDNSLTALSMAGTTAHIQKKDADGVTVTVDTEEIPEPATMALVLLSVVSLAGCRSRG